MFQVSVNNTPKTLLKPMTLQEALTMWGYATNGMLGVAINQVFVPKSLWEERQLQAGDELDILQPVVGG